MKSAMRTMLTALAVFALSTSAWAQGRDTDFSRIEILTEKIAPNLYLLSGTAGADPAHEDAAGGRIGILTGPDGIFMVDAQYAELAGKVTAAIRKISAARIRFLVNTHIHIDHTGGNAAFVKMGATLLAREELREDMLHPPGTGTGYAVRATDPAGVPSLTYGLGGPVRIYMNGETVDLIPVRAAHTGGDTMIRFEKADVIMIGDFYRNYGYPFIDSRNGGSVKGTLEALDALYALAGPDTRLVPGHGTVIERADLLPYRDMILSVRKKVQALIAQGKTGDEVLASKPTAEFDAHVPGGLSRAGNGTSADRFVAALYAELKSGR